MRPQAEACTHTTPVGSSQATFLTHWEPGTAGSLDPLLESRGGREGAGRRLRASARL